jgi:hypothetical protein
VAAAGFGFDQWWGGAVLGWKLLFAFGGLRGRGEAVFCVELYKKRGEDLRFGSVGFGELTVGLALVFEAVEDGNIFIAFGVFDSLEGDESTFASVAIELGGVRLLTGWLFMQF